MLRKPNPVWYFSAVMYNEAYVNDADSIVRELFGDFVLKSDEFSFDHTTYYQPEMGEGLKKYFCAFAEPCEPAFLAKHKLTAVAKEDELAVGGKRVINIDPGYLALEKVVVASTKNFTHRIYLSDGIFGDLQLMRHKGGNGEKAGYKGLPWTYADYLRDEASVFFVKLAEMLQERL